MNNERMNVLFDYCLLAVTLIIYAIPIYCNFITQRTLFESNHRRIVHSFVRLRMMSNLEKGWLFILKLYLFLTYSIFSLRCI